MGAARLEFGDWNPVVRQHRSEGPDAAALGPLQFADSRAWGSLHPDVGIHSIVRRGIRPATDALGPESHVVGGLPRDRRPGPGHLRAGHAERRVSINEALPLLQNRQGIAVTAGTAPGNRQCNRRRAEDSSQPS